MTTHPTHSSPGFVLALLIACAVAAGCEEMVDPVVPAGQPFSLYGYLDPRAPVQAIRVFPIEEALFPTEDAHIDARMVSERVSTGDLVEWRDSSIAFRFYYGAVEYDTTWGNVFWAAFTPDFGTTYALRVRRSDGAESAAMVTTPELVDVAFGAPLALPSNVKLPITYTGDVRLVTTTTIYTVSTAGLRDPWIIPIRRDGVLAQHQQYFEIPVSADLGVIYSLTGLRPGLDDVYLDALEVETFVTHPSWQPPDGRFDPDLLIEPGTFSNVSNGFGFVGAGYLERTVWTVDHDIAELAGFDRRPGG